MTGIMVLKVKCTSSCTSLWC